MLTFLSIPDTVTTVMGTGLDDDDGGGIGENDGRGYEDEIERVQASLSRCRK